MQRVRGTIDNFQDHVSTDIDFFEFGFSRPSALALFAVVALLFLVPDTHQRIALRGKPSALPPRINFFLNQPLPLMQAVARHWARHGRWVTAASATDDAPLFPPAVNMSSFPPDDRDFTAFIKSCGSDQARAIPLSQRWRFPDAVNSTRTPRAEPTYLTWNRDATCTALRGRAVIILGDSMSGEFTDTLVTALQSKESSPQLKLRSFRADVCDGNSVPVFSIFAPRWIGDDFPARWEEPTLHSQNVQNRIFFQELISEAAAAADRATGSTGGVGTLWVLNRGAHYADLDDHLDRVATTLDFVRYIAPRAAIFWRTTGPAHPDHLVDPAVQNSAPLKTPLGVDQYDVHWSRTYKWWEFYAQNDATLANLPTDVVPLEVHHSAMLRHDSHCLRGVFEEPDGLHYCMPGPIDSWVELFAAVVRFGLESK